ncbi:hypothetical protein [Falsiroseomonas tokyonensis]|uniref:Secreted protein n=1 Tax=Falsiroseomonas tokyonensis TaxID=430521 RepID=A0ABV7C2H6_9PROT|nr:hypothetical protein [Falsiroseomonas tokyonensis]MBU8540866.1 hypothetical protein [Falsiroseomonas tokyonensis]
MRRPLPLLLALLSPLLASAPLRAQEPPSCTEAREGTVACIAGKLCTCRFIPGGSMTRRPDRHGWDCGILRPACGEGLVPPSATPVLPELLPPSLLLPNPMPPYLPQPERRFPR